MIGMLLGYGENPFADLPADAWVMTEYARYRGRRNARKPGDVLNLHDIISCFMLHLHYITGFS